MRYARRNLAGFKRSTNGAGPVRLDGDPVAEGACKIWGRFSLKRRLTHLVCVEAHARLPCTIWPRPRHPPSGYNAGPCSATGNATTAAKRAIACDSKCCQQMLPANPRHLCARDGETTRLGPRVWQQSSDGFMQGGRCSPLLAEQVELSAPRRGAVVGGTRGPGWVVQFPTQKTTSTARNVLAVRTRSCLGVCVV